MGRAEHILELRPTILWPGVEDIEGFRVECSCDWVGEAFAATDIQTGLAVLKEALEHETIE
jgi:hypothetical protein